MDSANVLVKMECGKHYGAAGGPCKKCAYFASLESDPVYRKCLMHNGTPWVAIYGPVVNNPLFPAETQAMRRK